MLVGKVVVVVFHRTVMAEDILDFRAPDLMLYVVEAVVRAILTLAGMAVGRAMTGQLATIGAVAALAMVMLIPTTTMLAKPALRLVAVLPVLAVAEGE
jgi:hypothetical protein